MNFRKFSKTWWIRRKPLLFTRMDPRRFDLLAQIRVAASVTDSKDTPIWSAGMIVRSDGNNFIAELAAAAIAIKSCPQSLDLTMKIDSKAAIGALTRGAVSERKRVRAAGRAWLNFCRDDFLRKRKQIKIQHVSSHRGLG